MRPSNASLLGILLASFCLNVLACDIAEKRYGCKIGGVQCICSYGCAEEYVYRTRAACFKSLKERISNKCARLPCQRGLCISTKAEPGFACKCEGTGFYGSRCEKVCPTVPMRGLVFPHECVVI